MTARPSGKGAAPGRPGAWPAVLAVVAVMLAGCGGEGDESGSEVATTGDRQAPPTESTAPAVAPMREPVAIETTTELDARRRMTVSGRTNLPEETRLLVVVEREASGVDWRSRIRVADGAFTAGPLGPGSGLVAGRYAVRVSMPPADVQSQAVREVIGARGSDLRGPLVVDSAHGLGKVVEYAISVEVDR